MTRTKPGILGLGIRGKIVGVILLCMIPVLILGITQYWDQNRSRTDLVFRTQQDTARALSSDVETFVANAVHAELAAGSAVESQPYPVVGIVQLFAAIRRNDPSFLSLALALPDGRVDASDPPGGPGASVADRRGFAAVRRGAPWAVGDSLAAGGRPGVEVAAGITQDGRLAAVVDGIVDLTAVRPVMPTALSADMDGMIVDQGGRVVLDLRQPGRPAGTLAPLAPVREALGGRPAAIQGYADPYTRVREVGAAVPIPTLGWAAVVLEPEAAALEPVRRAAQQDLVWLLAYTALGLLLAWNLGGKFTTPIQALARGAHAIARGEVGHRVSVRRTGELGALAAVFDRIAARRPDELDALATAFNEMSAQLERNLNEMNALQAVSDAALSTVRLRELLPTLVQQIVSALRADRGTVWFVDETTGELVVPFELDGAQPGGPRRLPPGHGVAGRVAAGTRALVLSGEDALRALDPGLLAAGMLATLTVPLRVGGRVIGVIQVLSRRPREFRAQEIRLLETFADRVALAVDNARAYERQQEIAGIIQEALLPTPSVRLPGLAVAGRYLPSREVGGDFYAILPLGRGRVGLAIADVSGKGIPAATLSARARYLLEAFVLDGRPPEAVLTRLNAVLARDPASALFVSLFYAAVDPEGAVLRCTSAGHLPPLFLGAGAPDPVPLEVLGLLLGVDAETKYTAMEVRVAPGDLLVLFTDGITEARNGNGEQFGDGRLAALLAAHRKEEPEDIADRVMDEVARWSGGGPADDRALVVARVLPWGANVPDAARESSG